MTYSGKIPS